MPELAEVEFFRKQWDPALGKKIRAVRLHPKSRIFLGTDINALECELTGATLRHSETHGKQMLFTGAGLWLGIHLGMTGKLRLDAADYEPGKHDHFVLVQERQCAVFQDHRHFGRVRFHSGKEAPTWWRDLPPPVVSAKFTEEWVSAFLQRRAKAPIKSVLLMQERFPGIGNWMADEILWRSKIDPRRASGSLEKTEVRQLWRATKDISSQALKTIGKDWSDPPKSWLFSHRWSKGGTCPRCGGKLAHRTIGGRTTCYCPKCQAT